MAAANARTRTAPPRARNGGRPVGRQRASRNPDFDDATPIYVQLIMHFRKQIESEVWPVGQNIPALEELAADFGVARATIRQALSFLEREGLIVSRRGRGTTVLKMPKNDLWYQIPGTWDELVAIPRGFVGEQLDLSAPSRLPQLPDDGRGTLAPRYSAIRRVLKFEGVPYLIGTSYFDRRIVDEVNVGNVSNSASYHFLARSRRQPVAQAHQTLTLGSADAEAAYLLEVPLSAPLVYVLRWAFDADETLIYHSEGIFRSDFVRVTRRLK